MKRKRKALKPIRTYPTPVPIQAVELAAPAYCPPAYEPPVEPAKPWYHRIIF